MERPKTNAEKPKTNNLTELEHWFAKNKTEFDVSASGFHNFLKKYYPHLIK